MRRKKKKKNDKEIIFKKMKDMACEIVKARNDGDRNFCALNKTRDLDLVKRNIED